MFKELQDQRKRSFRREEIEIHIKFLIRVPDEEVHGPSCKRRALEQVEVSISEVDVVASLRATVSNSSAPCVPSAIGKRSRFKSRGQDKMRITIRGQIHVGRFSIEGHCGIEALEDDDPFIMFRFITLILSSVLLLFL